MRAPFHVFSDFLAESDRHALLGFALDREAAFVPTKVIKEKSSVFDPKQRLSAVLSDLGPWTISLRRAIRAVAPAIFSGCGVKPFDLGGIELELVAHNDGAHFGAHRDIVVAGGGRTWSDGTPAHRIVSGVYYFHSEPKRFTGGELRLHSFRETGGDDDFVDVEPAQNSLVVFPAFVRHEVMRVSCPSRKFSDSRFAVNYWLYKAPSPAATGA